MRRIRVLELIKGLDIGGAEMLLVERMRLLDRDRFEPYVGYLEAGREELKFELTRLGIPTVCFSAASNLDWSWTRELRRFLATHQIDVVHVHSPLMAAGVRLVVHSLRARRPALVTTEHSFRHHHLTQALDLLTVKADDLVLAVSRPVADSAICRAARSSEILHHGINLARLTELRRNRPNLEGELGLEPGPRVVSVANYRAEKGHAGLIMAAQLVHERVPKAHFYVAGHGPEEEYLRRQVEQRGMSDYYHLMGRVDAAARLSACADVFVLASEKEGRPVALMEAFACGVPSVVTRVGGMVEMVSDGRTGFFVDPGAANPLANRIAMLLTDPELAERMGAAARASSLDWDLALANERLQEIYCQLAVGRGPRNDRPRRAKDLDRGKERGA